MTTLAAEADSTAAETMEVITLRVGAQRLGVDIRYVTEINTRLRPFPAPVRSLHIAGVLNLRGEVVTVLKLDVLLGIERKPGAVANEPKYVLLRCGDERVAVEVDEVEDVQEVAREDIRPLPNNVKRCVAAITDGVHPRPSGMQLMLDVARLFSIDDGAKAR